MVVVVVVIDPYEIIGHCGGYGQPPYENIGRLTISTTIPYHAIGIVSEGGGHRPLWNGRV